MRVLDSMDSVTSSAFLNQKTHATFDGSHTSKSLAGLCLELLAQQKKTWPLLRKGYQSIRRGGERHLSCKGFSILLQHNRGRMKSTLAAVGEQDIGSRPCFLCLHHLPDGQRGILYGNTYLILGNPMPVFPAHFTIAHVNHRPQAISPHINSLLQLMADFGSGWALLYNGPKCGASAPDHFHFQAVPSGRMPIEKEIEEKRKLTLIVRSDDVTLYRAKGMGREAIIIEGGSPKAVGAAFKAFLNALKRMLGGQEEPMINVIGLYKDDRVLGHGARVMGRTDSRHSSLSEAPDTRQGGIWRLVVFPRRKHRPEAFFRTGDARVAVSPAVVEMGGIFVTPFIRDFERLDAAAVEAIYKEVSLEKLSVEKAIDAFR
jgi:hypothetical protein